MMHLNGTWLQHYNLQWQKQLCRGESASDVLVDWLMSKYLVWLVPENLLRCWYWSFKPKNYHNSNINNNKIWFCLDNATMKMVYNMKKGKCKLTDYDSQQAKLKGYLSQQMNLVRLQITINITTVKLCFYG